MNIKRWMVWMGVFTALTVLLTACGGAAAPQAPAGGQTAAQEPVLITGTMTYSNDFAVETYFYEQAVALNDMHGFVIRDQEWELPVESQVLGYLKVDKDKNSATYRLALPARPEGEFNDVDQNGKEDKGVQIFTVAYSPNWAGGPFSEGDDASRGWSSYIASTVTDSEKENEVVGGKLIIWAPDDRQQFPTGFGDDGKLFTADDPVGPVPAGYSVIDLDQKPFAVIREANPVVDLYEPKDYAIKDFSDLSYTQAFDQMFEKVKTEYAFNDIPGKAPDWDKLYSQLAPRVKEAEEKKSARLFFLALKDFTYAFKDAHVGLSGGSVDDAVFYELTDYGYGFALRELSDGSFLVVFVTPGGPAESAGMQVGAVVSKINGEDVAAARDRVNAYSGPFSTDHTRKYQQLRYLLRAREGEEMEVVFTNPGGSEQTARLKAFPERKSFSATSLYRGYNPNALPVEFEILDSGVGYIKLNSNYDDLNLVFRLFTRALATFEMNEVPGIIIDLRLNSGGQPLGLASFLTDKEIPTGQDEYFSEVTGKFEPSGAPGKIIPSEEQYRFGKMVLLVGQGCSSACEFEAYAFSQVPGMIVVGETPTGGLFGDVARGQFVLPGGISLQVPTGRTILPDGTILLEGVGVVPDEVVPVTAESVLSGGDTVLDYAVKLITGY